ncbi:MAG: hypothetical protein WCV82_01765 [Candidatus Paceibacterota bacterium]
MEFDYKILEEKFKQLPREIQNALTSTEIASKTKAISVKYALKLDQQSALFDLISYTMLGLASSKDFIKNLAKEAELTESVCVKIAEDVNSDIFSSIRSHMQEKDVVEPIQPIKKVDNASLEAAGNFSIEPTIGGNGHDTTAEAMTEGEKRELLAGIETPQTLIRRTTPEAVAPAPEIIHREPLVDQLLKGSASIPEEKIVRKVSESLNTPPASKVEPPNNLPTNDRYREPIQ